MDARRTSRLRAPGTVVAVCGLVVLATRLPFLSSTLGPDEGGFLMVGGQWHAGGTSLYGNYWVDRPPLLIALFGLAAHLGGAVALRLLGCVAALTVLVLAHVLSRVVTGRTTPWPVIAATAFLVMPIMGTTDVNGELLAAPFVVAGLLVAVRAAQGRGHRLLRWAAAGVLGTAAVMVKQNFVDVFVFGFVLLLVCLVRDRSRDHALSLAALVSGGVATTSAALGLAAIRGTTPGGLWNAMVVFRFHAARVIGSEASGATHERFTRLVVALAASGAVVLVVLLLTHAVRRPLDPLALATAALLGWELFAVLAGGSYWLHYLVGLVPGLILSAAQLTVSTPRRRAATRWLTTYAVGAAVVTFASAAFATPAPTTADRVSAWLGQHVRPGDSAVVLYGNANILQRLGLRSPYPELWSLPVRVRDPRLNELTQVLSGPTAPLWVVAWHDMASWGIEPDRAHQVVTSRYRLYANVCGVDVYRLGRPHGSHPPRIVCPES